MTDITMIALAHLTESAENVRRTNRRDGISQLAGSIRAHGLLQSLVVRSSDSGKFAVVAGGRRLRALRLLVKAGNIEKNTLIPCRVISGDEDAAELSLAENTVRLGMSLADEIGALAARIDAGEGPEAIAARFGVTPQHVARRAKLARVSPRLIAALRNGEIDPDQLAALALSDDHAAQERAFFDAPEWARTPDRLRAHITQAHVPDTDKLVRFVGIDAYRTAGGEVVSDLFAEDDDNPALWLTDRDLLTRLAEVRLQPIAEQARGEGWAWVEIAMDEIGWQRFPARVREERRTLTKREQNRLERLYANLDEAEDAVEIAKIEADIDALAPTSWPVEEVKIAGAVVTLTRDGAAKIERGLVRSEEMKALKALRHKAERADTNDEGDAEGGQNGTVAPPTRISAKLTAELQAHKTLALRVALAEQPDIGLRVLVFTLAEHFCGGSSASPLAVRVGEEDVGRSITLSDSKAPEAFDTIASAWRDRLPAEREALWRFVSDAEQQTLLELLAVMIAPGLDLRTDARMSGAEAQTGIGNLFATAANLDMSRWWTASADSYFAHVKRDVILDAIREHKPGVCVPKLEKASKAELIARTKRIFKDAAWLPDPLRPHSAIDHSTVGAIAAE
ncbi:MAG TPA: ParB/RepB/Spo0J family partition protein [Terricaulis sp.]|nr:ParB/RepB/Spo0J family partition protein [Terricaulis sp.]